MVNKTKPMGFQYKAEEISACKRDIIDLVEPQEGQGILVVCLMKQTTSSLLFGWVIAR